jgi:hypothetical protein
LTPANKENPALTIVTSVKASPKWSDEPVGIAKESRRRNKVTIKPTRADTKAYQILRTINLDRKNDAAAVF